MRQTFLVILLIVGSFMGFIGYCFLLVNWIEHVKTGTYVNSPLKSFLETLALLVYSYLAIHFMKSKTTLL